MATKTRIFARSLSAAAAIVAALGGTDDSDDPRPFHTGSFVGSDTDRRWQRDDAQASFRGVLLWSFTILGRSISAVGGVVSPMPVEIVFPAEIRPSFADLVGDATLNI